MVKVTHFTHLDFIRGVAALLVTAGHLRHLLFEGFARLSAAGVHVSVPWRVFYGVTGVSHEAVIVFFALSGFLVGGKVLSDLEEDRFSWLLFVLRRLTRLWIVIIPALFLTLAFDWLGARFTSVPIYDGAFFGTYSSGPTLDEPASHSLLTFIGNVFFLQKIYVPVFGSNGPLWSLANEFWYYVFFTCLFWVLFSRQRGGRRLAGIVALLLVAWMIPSNYWSGAFIWVSGAIAAWCSRQAGLRPYFVSNAVRFAAFVLTAAGLLISKMSPDIIGELILGAIVAAALPVVARLSSPGPAFDAVATRISDVSYTLYLTHFPLLMFMATVTISPHRSSPSLSILALFSVLFLVCLAWAYLVWFIFERNTNRVYLSLRHALKA